MASILAERRVVSADRLQRFQGKLTEASSLYQAKACVYVTGSYGRGEGGIHSDLDVFIVGASHLNAKNKEIRDLPKLEEICLKRELIYATNELKFLPFSGDGEYLVHYTIDQLVKTTGKPEDDANNTFTARLLLLLESKPLIGVEVYKKVIDATILQYWRDYGDHQADFAPGFLINDILRLWRTFCVNYEARTSTDPADEKNKRRLKNYKLKYSRMLTCYSALLYLLAIHTKSQTVSPEDVRGMIAMTPTERMENLLLFDHAENAHESVRKLLEKYEEFLANTNSDEVSLLKRMDDKNIRNDYFSQANAFGDAVFDLIEIVGRKSRLHRLLVV